MYHVSQYEQKEGLSVPVACFVLIISRNSPRTIITSLCGSLQENRYLLQKMIVVPNGTSLLLPKKNHIFSQIPSSLSLVQLAML